jgi:hypothetical protein
LSSDCILGQILLLVAAIENVNPKNFFCYSLCYCALSILCSLTSSQEIVQRPESVSFQYSSGPPPSLAFQVGKNFSVSCSESETTFHFPQLGFLLCQATRSEPLTEHNKAEKERTGKGETQAQQDSSAEKEEGSEFGVQHRARSNAPRDSLFRGQILSPTASSHAENDKPRCHECVPHDRMHCNPAVIVLHPTCFRAMDDPHGNRE